VSDNNKPEELTIIVQDRNIIRARTQDGGEVEGHVVLDDLRLKTIKLFEDWLAEGRIRKREELELLGTLLYEALFKDDKIVTFFEQALERAKAKGPEERLLLRLTFQKAASELRILPWEYLYRPETETAPGYFLSTGVRMVLSRYMPTTTGDQPLKPEEAPLNVLMVVSNPGGKDLGPVAPDEVIQTIQDLQKQRYPININILDKPTVTNLLDTLENSTPHVLHFVGYGHYIEPKDRSEIALLAPDENGAVWKSDDDFAEIFTQAGSFPSLVFLHLWDSTSVDPNANFDRLAPRLILENIPMVVAMRYPITKAAAIDFCLQFYRELARGKPVEHAVQAGRYRITLNDPKAYIFGSPVLYTRRSGSIVKSTHEPPSQRESPPTKFGGGYGARRRSEGGVYSEEPINDVRETEPSIATLAEDVIAAGKQRIVELNLRPDEQKQMEGKLSRKGEELYGKEAREIRAKVVEWLVSVEDESWQGVYLSMLKAIGEDTP